MKKLKLLKILSLLLYIFYVFSVIFMICIKKYNYSAICAGCIVINFILNLLNKKFTYLFNDALVILLELFVLFSLVLGTSYGGYKINHYDDSHVFRENTNTTSEISEVRTIEAYHEVKQKIHC